MLGYLRQLTSCQHRLYGRYASEMSRYYVKDRLMNVLARGFGRKYKEWSNYIPYAVSDKQCRALSAFISEGGI
jgi:hypothetical protein